MPPSHNEIQVTWDTGNNSDTITGESSVTGDAMPLTPTAIARAISLKANKTTGAPVAGDKTYFYALGTCGDPDGGGTDQFPKSNAQGLWLATIDHGAENPDVAFVVITVPMKSVKIFAKTLGIGAGDVVTVSARILETLST